jgi:hypothetical protein
MNMTNKTNDIKAGCNRRRIRLPIANPTPHEAIPIIERHLAMHRLHASANPQHSDHAVWKKMDDDLEKFLAEVRAQTVLSKTAENPAQTSAHQQNSSWTDVGQGRTDAGHPWTNAGQSLPTAGQTGQPTSTSAEPEDATEQNNDRDLPPSASDEKEYETEEADHEHHDERAGDHEDEDDEEDDFDEGDEENDETDDEDSSESSEPSEEDRDLQDEDGDDYETEAERIADLTADLQQKVKGRSRFDVLTAAQKDAIFALMQHYSTRALAKVLAEPPPNGFGFKISKSSLATFRKQYMADEMERRKEAARQADEQSFQRATASEQAFCEITESFIKRRLLHTVANEAADYHEIRWLLASLSMLRKSAAKNES